MIPLLEHPVDFVGYTSDSLFRLSARLFFGMLLRPFMAAPLPKPPFIPTLFHAENELDLTLDHWRIMMESHIPLVSQCFVSKVYHCKSQIGKQHEFLFFEILSPTGDRTTLMFADRCVDVDDIKTKSVVLRSPFWSSSTPPDVHALNYIHIVTAGTAKECELRKRLGKYHVTSTLEYSGGTWPSANNVCTLLNIVGAHASTYDIYEAHSAWFSHTVFTSLCTIFPGVIRTSRAWETLRERHSSFSTLIPDGIGSICAKYHEAAAQAALKAKQEQQANKVVCICHFLLCHVHFKQEMIRAEGMAEEHHIWEEVVRERDAVLWECHTKHWHTASFESKEVVCICFYCCSLGEIKVGFRGWFSSGFGHGFGNWFWLISGVQKPRLWSDTPWLWLVFNGFRVITASTAKSGV